LIAVESIHASDPGTGALSRDESDSCLFLGFTGIGKVPPSTIRHESTIVGKREANNEVRAAIKDRVGS
jgi:hypothetical protein